MYLKFNNYYYYFPVYGSRKSNPLQQLLYMFVYITNTRRIQKGRKRDVERPFLRIFFPFTKSAFILAFYLRAVSPHITSCQFAKINLIFHIVAHNMQIKFLIFLFFCVCSTMYIRKEKEYAQRKNYIFTNGERKRAPRTLFSYMYACKCSMHAYAYSMGWFKSYVSKKL